MAYLAIQLVKTFTSLIDATQETLCTNLSSIPCQEALALTEGYTVCQGLQKLVYQTLNQKTLSRLAFLGHRMECVESSGFSVHLSLLRKGYNSLARGMYMPELKLLT